jgi:hypothetical protein
MGSGVVGGISSICSGVEGIYTLGLCTDCISATGSGNMFVSGSEYIFARCSGGWAISATTLDVGTSGLGFDALGISLVWLSNEALSRTGDVACRLGFCLGVSLDIENALRMLNEYLTCEFLCDAAFYAHCYLLPNE